MKLLEIDQRRPVLSVLKKAKSINCNVALYNHKGWFGNPLNQLDIIKALPNQNLSLVYNFHHAHKYVDEFPEIVKIIKSPLDKEFEAFSKFLELKYDTLERKKFK